MARWKAHVEFLLSLIELLFLFLTVEDAGLKSATRGTLKYRWRFFGDFFASETQKNRQKIAIWAPSHNFVGLYLRN